MGRALLLRLTALLVGGQRGKHETLASAGPEAVVQSSRPRPARGVKGPILRRREALISWPPKAAPIGHDGGDAGLHASRQPGATTAAPPAADRPPGTGNCESPSARGQFQQAGPWTRPALFFCGPGTQPSNQRGGVRGSRKRRATTPEPCSFLCGPPRHAAVNLRLLLRSHSSPAACGAGRGFSMCRSKNSMIRFRRSMRCSGSPVLERSWPASG